MKGGTIMYNRHLEFGLGITGAIISILFWLMQALSFLLTLLFGRDVMLFDLLWNNQMILDYGYGYVYSDQVSLLPEVIIGKAFLLFIFLALIILGLIGAIKVREATKDKAVTSGIFMLLSGAATLFSCNIFGLLLVAAGILALVRPPKKDTA